jgi:GNAT superfamily N-acetyltransferase
VHPQQIALPAGLRAYPAKYESEGTFAGNRTVHFRPVRPTDERLLKEIFYSHGEETILQRYFTRMRHLPHEEAQRMVTLDYRNEMALIGLIRDEGADKIACVGRYKRTAQRNAADMIITVRDDLQGLGLGKQLLARLSQVARDNGITCFHARFRADNERMRTMLRDAVGAVESTLDGEYLEVKFPLCAPDTANQESSSPKR